MECQMKTVEANNDTLHNGELHAYTVIWADDKSQLLNLCDFHVDGLWMQMRTSVSNDVIRELGWSYFPRNDQTFFRTQTRCSSRRTRALKLADALPIHFSGRRSSFRPGGSRRKNSHQKSRGLTMWALSFLIMKKRRTSVGLGTPSNLLLTSKMFSYTLSTWTATNFWRRAATASLAVPQPGLSNKFREANR